MIYSAKVGNRFAPILIQSVVSSEPTYLLPEDLQAARRAYAMEQEAKKIAKEAHAWDGAVFQLKSWDISASEEGERKALILRIEPGRYFDFVITHLKLREIPVADTDGSMISAYEKYVERYVSKSRDQPNPALSNMFGVSLTAVTSDGYVILHRRSKRNAVVPEFIHVSVAETIKAADPHTQNATSDAEPDPGQLIYNTAVRGMEEELCIADFDREKVNFLGLIYSPELLQFDVVGVVKLPFTAAEVQSLAKGGRDQTYENESMIVLPFSSLAVAKLMKEESYWSPFAVASIIIALQFEFGSRSVDRDFAAVFGDEPVQLKQFKFQPQL